MQRFSLNGKVAIVTGGNGGIGLGIARGFVEAGAAVVVVGRNSAKNTTAVSELTSSGGTSAFVVDVADEAQCQRMVAETVKVHGRLDILVNNAGIGNRKSPQDTTIAEWHAVMDTNLTSVMMCSQAAYPEMKKIGGGKIINIGSMASQAPPPGSDARAPLGSRRRGQRS